MRRSILALTILTTVALCVIFFVFVFSRPAAEPSYQGVTLTDWLKTYRAGVSHHVTNAEAKAEAAVAAVRAMNGDALQPMLRWISFRPSRWRMRLVKETEKLPLFAQNSPPVTWLRPDIEYERLGLAPGGFMILGSNAIPAIPTLGKIAADPTAPGRYGAIRALFELGPPAIPALTNLLTSRQPYFIQAEIRMNIGRLGPGAEVVIAALIRDITNSDAQVAGQSAMTLGHIGRQPEIVVPALIAALDDRRPSVRQCAASALGYYGDAARPAVPKLRSLLGAGSGVGEAARMSLLVIAPEVLTNAPSQ